MKVSLLSDYVSHIERKKKSHERYDTFLVIVTNEDYASGVD